VRPEMTDTLRALVCRVLLGLAADAHILHTLQALQVGINTPTDLTTHPQSLCLKPADVWSDTR
jgi:hypothetical protein